MYELPLLPRTEAHSSTPPEPPRVDPLLRGPGWQLFVDAAAWRVRVAPQLVNPAASYADIRRRLGQLSARLGPRPLLLDLRAAPRLDGPGPRELHAVRPDAWLRFCAHCLEQRHRIRHGSAST